MKKQKITSGILFIYKNKILLVHSNKNGWNNLTYPKGKVKKYESIKDAAIREVKEEINLVVHQSLLTSKNLYVSEYNNRIDYYYLINLNEKMFKLFFNNNLNILHHNLKNEVDWGKFIDKQHIVQLLNNRFLFIKNHIRY